MGRRHTRAGERTRNPRVRWWMAGCLGGVLALTGCGSGHTGSAGTSSTAPPSVPVTIGASGCQTPGQAPSAPSATLTISVDGHPRTVIVHAPAGYTGSTKVPLVLNMHGSGSTALEQEGFTGMDGTADADGFIVAYPQALLPEGSGFDWNVPGVPLVGGKAVPAGAADDVAFLTQLVSQLQSRYCIDSTRVYATGFSGGARMASQLACDSSTTFAAVAPVSGLRIPTPCRPARPVPIVAFHGEADPVDPYGGHGQAYWTYSVLQAAQGWGRQNGCSPTAATSPTGPQVTLTSYSGCSAGATVELYSIAGEGHEWAGGPRLPKAITDELGPQSDAIDADATIWAFFAAHPMP
jgi:polyhydroxybutyrate depolymerase